MRRECPISSVWLVVVLAVAMAGCAGTQQPLADLLKPLTPMTPQEAARNAFNAYDADVRRQGVAALTAAPFGGEEEYVRMYRLLVDDPDPTVRASCIKALGMHGDVEDAPTLIIALSNRDESPSVRWEAAKALCKIHHPDAVRPLIIAADDTKEEDAIIRLAAADALGQYPQSSVFQALVGALDDRDFGVATAAHQSLQTLTGRDFGMKGSGWLNWAQQNPGEIFKDQQQYTYKPYVRPKSVFKKMKFWEEDEPVEPIVPKGLGDKQATGDSRRSSPTFTPRS